MGEPIELSLSEIRNFMLANGCKVTNHALVRYFKKFLTNSETQNEARKQFKTYVNILATMKTENNEKYLILRRRYLNECPSEDIVDRTDPPMSPGSVSISTSEGFGSPLRQPPPYKPPPQVISPIPTTSAAVGSSGAVKLPILQQDTREHYRDCIYEFQAAVNKLDSNRLVKENSDEKISAEVSIQNSEKVLRDNHDSNNDKENISISVDSGKIDSELENTVSVKEAARKFNRMASEEEAKVLSPSNKKKTEKVSNEEKIVAEVTMAHPKAKEWVVAAAKASYQELAKLAQEYPELAKLQDPTATALHWAAKHGNEDVVKLIAGTYKADVNARTGYTPLHITMQFGKDNIFELLCNVYKANRDLLDWSGNKPLDYRKQQTTVSASTYSKIKERRKHSEKDLGFLRIGSLNVRVKKTTEAFSNFLGVGGGSTNNSNTSHHHHAGTTKSNPMNRTTSIHHRVPMYQRTSMPTNVLYDKHAKMHKTWGSADNIQNERNSMPPPKHIGYLKKHKSKRLNTNTTNSINFDSTGYSSMPTTPNQIRAPINILNDNNQSNTAIDSDSDSACGFDSNWSVDRSNKNSSSDSNKPTYI